MKLLEDMLLGLLGFLVFCGISAIVVGAAQSLADSKFMFILLLSIFLIAYIILLASLAAIYGTKYKVVKR